MTKLTPITAKQMIKILLKLRFHSERQKGSHIFFRHDDGRTTTVPVHSGEKMDRSLVRKILRDVDMTPEEFEDLRRKK